jgi:glycosyltransferase involved in cell wall biosynthesis
MEKSWSFVNRKTIFIRQQTHGKHVTGGSIYEEFFLEKLAGQLEAEGMAVATESKFYNRNFRGLNNFRLLFSGWKNGNADVNIVAARLGLPVIIRNLFNSKKTLIVLHNYDPEDGKSWFLKLYYGLLFSILKLKPAGVGIVCVAPYFKKYFSGLFPSLPVFYFPNLFNNREYQGYRTSKDPRKIFLGQYSAKKDDSILEIAKKLTGAGYTCFFCSLNPEDASRDEFYEIKSIPFSAYLHEMATSYCTLALPGVNEGWNRIAHESLLVGTPVIGYDKGGLGDLLRESDSYIVNSSEEVVDLIMTYSVIFRDPVAFLEKYDSGNSRAFLEPVLDFILKP